MIGENKVKPLPKNPKNPSEVPRITVGNDSAVNRNIKVAEAAINPVPKNNAMESIYFGKQAICNEYRMEHAVKATMKSFYSMFHPVFITNGTCCKNFSS